MDASRGLRVRIEADREVNHEASRLLLIPHATNPAVKVEANFEERRAAMPTDILRQHLLAMAPSPEAFLTCRGGFARSLATLSACCYIMGIGDRHLDNFLLDTTTG